MTLRLAPRAAHVRTARLVASAMARRSGVDEAVLDDVRLAVGEACARAVMLHERHALDHPVTVELADDDRFSVTVTDRFPQGAGARGAGGQRPSAGRGEEAEWSATGPAAGQPAQRGGVEALVLPADSDELLRAAVDWSEAERLGLAVLAGVVDDLTVEHGEEGTRVHMSWPACS